MVESLIDDHIKVFRKLKLHKEQIIHISNLLIAIIEKGNKILICGNGGSASDAQHFTAELVGKFKHDRSPFPCICLNTNNSILTSISNDYSFDQVFERQIKSLGKPGDVLIGISTSGNSSNIINAFNTAKNMMKIKTISLTGCDGGNIKKFSSSSLIVGSYETERIQEAHIFILHYLARNIEMYFKDIN